MIQTQQSKKEWEVKKLSEVCEIKKGELITKKTLTEGNIPVIAGGRGPAYYHNEANRTGETITISASGAYAGYVNFFVEPIFVSDCTAIKSQNERVILTKYVSHFLKSKQSEIYRFQTGSGQPHVYPKDLAKMEIPVPPLEIQKQTVAILERAEKLKQRREQVNNEMKKIIQSVFVEMFGDPIKNEKKFPIDEFQNIASEERYALKRGPFGGSLKKEIFVNEGYKVYEQQHAIKNNFELGNYYITSEKYEEMKPFAIHPSDIIISCSGTIGKIAIVPKTAKLGIINQALLKITLDKEKVTPVFMKYLLETPSVQRLFFGTARGSGIQNVASMPFIKSTKIPIPPLSLQKKFEKIVENIENIKNHQINTTKEINVLFGALIQKAFNGTL